MCEFVRLFFREMANLQGKGMGTVENIDKFNHSVFCPVGVSEDLIQQVMTTSCTAVQQLLGARDCAAWQYKGGRGGGGGSCTARARAYIRCG